MAAKMPDPSLNRCSSCFFPTEFHEVPLVNVKAVNHDTKVFTFGLPAGVSLDLPVCACLLLRGFDDKGKPAVRPYTPISSNNVKGSFSLCIKVYPQGVVSQWLDKLKLGSMVGFKHVPFNIKAQYPFDGKRKLNMICGGTGITPMYQALQKIADTPGDQLQVVALVGNRTPADILLRAELEEVVRKGRGRIKVVHVIGTKADQKPIAGWEAPRDGELGWVDEDKIRKFCFGPAPDVLTMVCGVPGLYTIMCGPRTDPEIKAGTVLDKLGYTTQMMSKM